MKKSVEVKPHKRGKLIAIFLVIIIILFGGYALFHKPARQITSLKSRSQKSSLSDELINISVGKNPTLASYDSKKGTIDVIDKNGKEITMIDKSSKKVKDKIPVGFQASSLVSNSKTNEIIVGGSISSSNSQNAQGIIEIINDTNDKIISNIIISTPIVKLTDNPDTGTIYAVEAEILNTTTNIMQSTILEINLSINTIESQITIEGSVSSIAYDQQNNNLYVGTITNSNQQGNLVIIDTNANKVSATLEVGLQPSDIIYDTENGNVYVANSLSSSVSLINTSSNTIVTIPVDVDPVSLTFDTNNDLIYAADESTRTLSIINTTTGTFEGTVQVGGNPDSLTEDNNGNLYIVENGTGIVQEISDNNIILNETTEITILNSTLSQNISVEATLPVGGAPTEITYDTKNELAYLADSLSNTVSVINTTTNTVIENIIVGENPTGILYDAVNSEVYVANTNSSTLSIIDTHNNNVTETLQITDPSGITYDNQNDLVYVTSSSSNNVIVINGSSNTLETTIKVGDNPTSISYDPQNSEVYVADTNSNEISVINTTTNQVVDTVVVGNHPTSITVDTNNGEVFVGAESNNASVAEVGLYVIDEKTNHVTNEIDIGEGTSTSATFDPKTDEVIVADNTASTISVVNANTNVVEETVSVSAPPTSVTYDQSTNTVAVVSASSDTVTLASPGL